MNLKCKLAFHSWHACKCRKCGKMRDEAHDWTGCTCTVCGKRREEGHHWAACKCLKCGKTRNESHEWSGCTCAICGKNRDDGHDWTACKCRRCGKVAAVGKHDWTDNCNVCRVCGFVPTPTIDIPKGLNEHWTIRLPRVKVSGRPLNNSQDERNLRRECLARAEAVLPRLRFFTRHQLKIAVPWEAHEPGGTYFVSDLDSNHYGENRYDARDSSSEIELLPLHLAALVGNKDMVEFFLQRGADVNAWDAEGHTPLYYAARWGRPDVAELLLHYGADVNARDRVCRHTPLYWAVWDLRHDPSRKDVAELLRQSGGQE